MTSEEFKTHLKSYSPFNVWVFAFTKEEIEEICKALDQKDLVAEIGELLKGENGEVIRN